MITNPINEDKINTYVDFDNIFKKNPSIVPVVKEQFKKLSLNGVQIRKRATIGIKEYTRYSITTPIYWQEYYYLFYLSLAIIKKYESNSVIIALGESPMKLVFSQSLFYDDPDAKLLMKDNGFPEELSFKYFSLSKLSYFVDKIKTDFIDSDIIITKDLFELLFKKINDNVKSRISDEIIQKFWVYFKKFNCLLIIN